MKKKHIIEVSTGEVISGADDVILMASAIGSCIAVVAYDKNSRRGGIAHIMLPGCCPDHKATEELRYAENAFRRLLDLMTYAGADRNSIIICVAGAGNVLKRSDDTVCSRNIESVLGILSREGLAVSASSLGGTERRRIMLDIERGAITCATGSGPDNILWKQDW